MIKRFKTEGPRRRTLSAFEQLKSLLFRKEVSQPSELTSDHIASIVMVRQARDAVFGSDLFSDPAWDILLELYTAYLEERPVTLGELTASTRTAPSTMSRWIVALERHGLVRREKEATDIYQVEVRLTPKAVGAIKDLADHWGSAFRSI